MDEIGFLESDAEAFCKAVLAQLDGSLPVLAAVRSGMESAFLREVTGHPKVSCYNMCPERFEEFYQELRPVILRWAQRLRENRRT